MTGFQVDEHRFLLYHHYAIDIDVADDVALINLNAILFEAGYDEPSDFPGAPVLWERLPDADDKPQPTEQRRGLVVRNARAGNPNRRRKKRRRGTAPRGRQESKQARARVVGACEKEHGEGLPLCMLF